VAGEKRWSGKLNERCFHTKTRETAVGLALPFIARSDCGRSRGRDRGRSLDALDLDRPWSSDLITLLPGAPTQVRDSSFGESAHHCLPLA
jgi:hypothetical protein